jgi:hypothetical protein
VPVAAVVSAVFTRVFDEWPVLAVVRHSGVEDMVLALQASAAHGLKHRRDDVGQRRIVHEIVLWAIDSSYGAA